MEKQRVCLIIPPSPFLADERVFISLGPLKVAASLEKAGYPVDVLDLSGVGNYIDVVLDYAKNNDVNTFGLSATTPQMPNAKTIMEALRIAKPKVRLILGGAHPTVVNAAKKREEKRGIPGRAVSAFQKILDISDVVVAGDGEIAIFPALQPDAPRLIDGDDPDSQFFLSAEGLGELPPPARHLVDLSSYHYSISGVPACSFIMQLGCSFGCRFCSGRLSPSFRRVRIRGIDSVIDEIRGIYQAYKFRGYMMYDDELNINPNMISDLNAICDLQDELGETFAFRGFIKANLFTEPQAEAMKRAGFKEMCVGFESGSPRILQNIKKQSTVEQNTRCVEIAKKYDMRIKGFCSVGHAGETEETIGQTNDWLLNVGVDDFDLTIISSFPGTPYHDDAVHYKDDIWVYQTPENGDRLYAQEVDYTQTAEYYKGQIEDGYRSYVFTDALSQDEIVKLRDWTERNVRGKLKIPFYQTKAAMLYDHSMGQIPHQILRGSAGE